MKILSRSNKLFLTLGALLVSSLIGERISDAAEGGGFIYQAVMKAKNISGAVSINGIALSAIAGDTTLTLPLNPWLMGNNNAVGVKVSKKDKSNLADFSLEVSRVSQGESMDTGATGNILSVRLTDQDLARSEPVPVSKTFSANIDFSRRLLSSQEGIVDEGKIIAYGATLAQQLSNKDLPGLKVQFSHKVEDYSKAFNASPSVFAQDLEAFLKDIFKGGSLNKIDPSHIKAKRMGANINLWHLLEGDKELIRAKSPDGGDLTLPVYVGLVEGELKVLR